MEPKGRGFCSTPNKVADLMIHNGLFYCDNSLNIDILEPSCGSGVIISRLLNRGFKNITAIEKNQIGDQDLYALPEYLRSMIDFTRMDFMEYKPEKKFDFIVMNPPFDHAIKHIFHAAGLLKPNGVLVTLMPNFPVIDNIGIMSGLSASMVFNGIGSMLFQTNTKELFMHYLGNTVCDYNVDVNMFGIRKND